MTRGIIFVVYGDEYDKIGSACCRVSRQYTDLPFHVVANHERTDRWDGIENVSWAYFDRLQSENRTAKLKSPMLSPFDQTLYIDCDSIIQRSGIDLLFGLLDQNDVALYQCYRWERGDPVLNIYKKAMLMFGVEPPVSVWQGGVVGFTDSDKSVEFFQRWFSYWDRFGRQREMPCLTCAVVNTPGLSVGVLPNTFYGYEGGMCEDAVIQHHVGNGFLEKFNIEKFNNQEPKTEKDDFTWVDWENHNEPA